MRVKPVLFACPSTSVGAGSAINSRAHYYPARFCGSRSLPFRLTVGAPVLPSHQQSSAPNFLCRCSSRSPHKRCPLIFYAEKSKPHSATRSTWNCLIASRARKSQRSPHWCGRFTGCGPDELEAATLDKIAAGLCHSTIL
jgi:hypothetical protein